MEQIYAPGSPPAGAAGSGAVRTAAAAPRPADQQQVQKTPLDNPEGDSNPKKLARGIPTSTMLGLPPMPKLILRDRTSTSYDEVHTDDED